jgi:hypothetical protein
MRTVYLISAIIGTVLPYVFFIQFFGDSGINLALFARQMVANPIAAAFAADVIVSYLVFWVFVFMEGRRLGMKHLWVFLAFNLAVGLSLALPAFLYARDRKMTTPGPS